MAEDTFSRALRAWHGSPHDFDEFQDKAIGTGEGTKSMGGYGVYGHGHYVAEARSVGEEYRNRLNQIRNQPAKSTTMFRGTELRQLYQTARDHFNHELKINHLQKEIDRVKGLRHLLAKDEYLSDLRENLRKLKDTKQIYEEVLEKVFPEYLKENRNVRDFMNDILVEVNTDDPLASFSTFQDSVRGAFSEPDKYNPAGGGLYREDVEKAFKVMLPLINEIKTERTEQKEGRLYELNLNVEPSELLLWDQQLEEHHPEAYNKIHSIPEIEEATSFDYDENGEPRNEQPALHPEYSEGEDVYKQLVKETGSAIKASALLLKHGIKGIKYEDQQSRTNQKQVLYDGKPLSDNRLQEAVGYLNNHHFDDDGKLVHDKVPFLAQNIREVGELRKKLWEDSAAHRGDGTDMYGRTDEYWKGHFRVAKALEDNPDKFTFELPPKTYNYVIFDPRAIRILRKYGMKNEVVKDFTDTGVHVKSVNHDPFEKE